MPRIEATFHYEDSDGNTLAVSIEGDGTYPDLGDDVRRAALSNFESAFRLVYQDAATDGVTPETALPEDGLT